MQAREAEQALIFLHGRQASRVGTPLGGQLLNRVNSISEKNPRLAEHIENGLGVLQRAGYR